MTELQRMLKGEAEADGRLDLAAAEIARLEYPDLDPAEVAAKLDTVAADVPATVNGGEEFVDELNFVLFERWGFQGNHTNYYDPLNSCLNEVLRRRVGIPITLSVVYLEVARRHAQPVFGVGLPGHFIVEYDSPEYSTFLDPFHDGRRLTPAECEKLGSQPFRKSTRQAIVVRMLQNLKGIYAKERQWAKVLRVCDLLIEGDSTAAGEWRVRGAANLQLKRYSAGKADLEEYLRLVPDSQEAGILREQIANLNRWSAQWN